jgi:ribosomal subunit interface protein
MKTNITFRHFNASHPDLQELAKESAHRLTKFHDSIMSTHVDFINEGDKTVQFTVNVGGATLVAKETSTELKKSLALAEDKMIRQIKKLKTKQATHKI